MNREITRAATAAVALSVTASLALAGPVDFTLSSRQATADLSAQVGDTTDTAGGPFSAFQTLNVSFGPSIVLDEETNASASGSLQATILTDTLSLSGNVGTDSDGNLAIASASVGFTIQFDVTEYTAWTISGYAGGVHAYGTIDFRRTGATDPIVDSYNPDFEGFGGFLTPGSYTLTANASSYTNSSDGYNGLFGGANFGVDLYVPAPGSLALLGAGLLIARRRR